MIGLETMLGRTFVYIDNRDDEQIIFVDTDGSEYIFHHEQDCCETVRVIDIVGDLNDLMNCPLLIAEESTSDKRPEDQDQSYYRDDSETWTFYRFATIKGTVVIRWCGSSNGYYSESVQLDINL